MVAHPSVENGRLRLDPFALPSDTTFRFVLLIAAVIGSSLFIFTTLYNGINTRTLLEESKCRLDISGVLPLLTADFSSVEKFEEAKVKWDALDSDWRQCLAPFGQDKAKWVLSGLVLLLSISAAVYWFFPAIKIRRSRLHPISSEEHQELVASVGDLCREAGLPRMPQLLWNPLQTTATALAFGRWGRYHISLNGGLVRQFYADSEHRVVRAVLLHELAHIRNADIDKTYFAVATVVGFVITALIPFAGYILRPYLRSGLDNDYSFLFSMTWRVLVLTTLVYLAFVAVLRAREAYADARAAQWAGAGEELVRIFATVPTTSQPKRVWRVWRRHPDPGERLRMLNEPERLLNMGFWEAFLTGVVASVAFESVEALVQTISQAMQRSYPIGVATALVFASLTAAVVGTGMWRITAAARATGGVARGAVRLAAGLTGGIVLGLIVAFQSAFRLERTLEEQLLAVSADVLLAGVLLLSLIVFLQWIAKSASIWIDLSPAGLIPRPAYIASLITAGLVLAVWSSALYQIQQFSLIASSFSEIALAYVAPWLGLPVWLLLLALASICAVPLGAAIQRQKTRRAAGSGTLAEMDREAVPVQGRSILQTHFVLGASLVGGLVFFLLLLAYRLDLHFHTPLAQRMSLEFAVDFAFWQFARAEVVALLVAAVVVGWSEQLAVLQGLGAVFVTACTTMLAQAIVYQLVGCIDAISLKPGNGCGAPIDFGFAWLFFGYVATGAGLFAIPITVVVSLLAARWRLAVQIGLTGGLVFCLLWFGTSSVLRFVVTDPPNEWPYRTALAIFIGVTQVAVGMVAVYRIRARRIRHALVATFVAGGMILGGVFGLSLNGQRLKLDEIIRVAMFLLPILATSGFLAASAAMLSTGVVPRFRPAQKLGLLGGCIFAGLWLIASPLMRFGDATVVPRAVDNNWIFLLAMGLTAVIQIGVSIVAAVRATKWRVVQSLVAVFIATVLITITVLSLTIIPNFDLATVGWFGPLFLVIMLLIGFAFALPIGGMIASGAWAMHRLRRSLPTDSVGD